MLGESKHPLKSTTIQASLTSAVTAIVALVTAGDDAGSELWVSAVTSILMSAIAIWGRFKADQPVQTNSKAAAGEFEKKEEQ